MLIPCGNSQFLGMVWMPFPSTGALLFLCLLPKELLSACKGPQKGKMRVLGHESPWSGHVGLGCIRQGRMSDRHVFGICLYKWILNFGVTMHDLSACCGCYLRAHHSCKRTSCDFIALSALTLIIMLALLNMKLATSSFGCHHSCHCVRAWHAAFLDCHPKLASH
eukprot:scaffold180528_cov19-Tisochrysis_lutea.AAC.1